MSIDLATRELSFRNTVLPVLEAGAGETVGYLHGPLGNPGIPAVIEKLAEHHRVVAPTLPGFFGTQANSNLRTLHDWVGALSEVIDLAGLTGRPVIASSVTAMLALELAAIRPEAFSRLVLIGPLGLWDTDEPVIDLFSQGQGREAKTLVNDPSLLDAIYSTDVTGVGDEVIERTVNRYVARTTCASLVWPFPEFGLADRIHRVSAPVRLIWGAEDKVVPPSYAAKFRELLPSVEAVDIVPDAGHLVDLDRPEVVVAALADAGSLEVAA